MDNQKIDLSMKWGKQAAARQLTQNFVLAVLFVLFVYFVDCLLFPVFQPTASFTLMNDSSAKSVLV